MSLFENPEYRWRETYFVLFHEKDRPAMAAFQKMIQSLGTRCHVEEVREDDAGRLESLTLFAPDDCAAMDITYVSGEDVVEQVQEIVGQARRETLSDDEKAKLKKLANCDSRYEVYHFEQMVAGEDDDDEILDPGALLIVIDRLAHLCRGVGIDPQSGSFL